MDISIIVVAVITFGAVGLILWRSKNSEAPAVIHLSTNPTWEERKARDRADKKAKQGSSPAAGYMGAKSVSIPLDEGQGRVLTTVIKHRGGRPPEQAAAAKRAREKSIRGH